MTEAAAAPPVHRSEQTTAEDLAVVVGLLRPFPVSIGEFRCTTLPGAPRPKARPRFNRKTGSTYTLKEDRVAEERTRDMLRHSGVRVRAGEVVVALLFVCPDRRIRDGDNMVKHALDAATGVLWANDARVIGHAAFRTVDARRPRTVLAVASVR